MIQGAGLCLVLLVVLVDKHLQAGEFEVVVVMCDGCGWSWELGSLGVFFGVGGLGWVERRCVPGN